MDVTIRPLAATDKHDLGLTCWVDWSEAEVEEFVETVCKRQERGLLWPVVAEADQVIGFGMLGRWGTRSEISNLIVAEQWRSQGIGTAIVRRLLTIAHCEGLGRVEIGVAASNEGALTLYQRLGFRKDRDITLDVGSGPEIVHYLVMDIPREYAPLGCASD